MLVAACKNKNGWALIPQDGRFAGQVVAEVEALSMEKVEVEARSLIGTLKAVWGVTVLIDEAMSDGGTVKSLGIGKNFGPVGGPELRMDYDGLWSANALVKKVRRLSAFGNKIYGGSV